MIRHHQPLGGDWSSQRMATGTSAVGSIRPCPLFLDSSNFLDEGHLPYLGNHRLRPKRKDVQPRRTENLNSLAGHQPEIPCFTKDFPFASHWPPALQSPMMDNFTSSSASLFSFMDEMLYQNDPVADTKFLDCGEVASNPERRGKIGIYSPRSRKRRIRKYLDKQKKRVWVKRIKYNVRKNFADTRIRVKGRFVKKEDEKILRTNSCDTLNTNSDNTKLTTTK